MSGPLAGGGQEAGQAEPAARRRSSCSGSSGSRSKEWQCSRSRWGRAGRWAGALAGGGEGGVVWCGRDGWHASGEGWVGGGAAGRGQDAWRAGRRLSQLTRARCSPASPWSMCTRAACRAEGAKDARAHAPCRHAAATPAAPCACPAPVVLLRVRLRRRARPTPWAWLLSSSDRGATT